jgi:hypothetical protein
MKTIGKILTLDQQLLIRGGVGHGGDCSISCKDKDNNVLGTATTDNCNTGNNIQKCKDAGYDKTDTTACSCGDS